MGFTHVHHDPTAAVVGGADPARPSTGSAAQAGGSGAMLQLPPGVGEEASGNVFGTFRLAFDDQLVAAARGAG